MKQEKLIEMIELGYGLEDRLVTCGGIYEKHRQEILAKIYDIEKKKTLIDIIRRRSYNASLKFIDCLKCKQIKQQHVAHLLLESKGYFINIFLFVQIAVYVISRKLIKTNFCGIQTLGLIYIIYVDS